jgi:O-antigen/teichoic acid export membrane protein
VLLLFLNTFQGGGVSAALVQRRQDLRQATASAFGFTLAAAAAAYLLLFALAPPLGDFFHSPRFPTVMRVLALVLIAHAFAVVPLAMLSRELTFKRRAIGEISGGIAQSATALVCAAAGAGVWSLVAAQLVGTSLSALLWWVVAPLRPNLRDWSWPVLRSLLGFGRFVSANRFIALLTTTVDNLTVGRLLGTVSVGFYGIAYRVSTVPNSVLAVVTHVVMLPALSHVQDDRRALKNAYLTSVGRLAFLAFPFAAAVGIGAHPLVVGLLGHRWEPAIGPLRLLAAYTVVAAISSTVDPALEAIGRPQLSLYAALPNAVALVPVLYAFTSAWGITGTAAGMIVAVAPTAALRFAIAIKIFGLRVRELVVALVRPAACTLLLGGGLIPLVTASESGGTYAALAALLAGAPLIYLTGAWFLAREVLLPTSTAFRGRA